MYGTGNLMPFFILLLSLIHGIIIDLVHPFGHGRHGIMIKGGIEDSCIIKNDLPMNPFLLYLPLLFRNSLSTESFPQLEYFYS